MATLADYWKHIRDRREHITQELSGAVPDKHRRQELQKELSRATDLLAKKDQVDDVERQLATISRELEQSGGDPQLKELFQEEHQQLEKLLVERSEELDQLLFPPDKLDDRSVYLEIRYGTGGDEAALFVTDLAKMYIAYAARMGWKAQIEETSGTDLGGCRGLVLHIEGKRSYAHLKHESGVHRVQRIPVTETSGRIHTSTVTVAVLPEADEVDVNIVPSDLRIDVFRASGAGGQHVNTTDSAVRVTHIPTGFVVSCQDERSQHKNKAKALKILHARLMAHMLEKQHEETGKVRKEQIGKGMRAEKVRTYNFPQNRVTDHRINLTVNKLDRVMEGELDEIVCALRDQERKEQKMSDLLLQLKGTA